MSEDFDIIHLTKNKVGIAFKRGALIKIKKGKAIAVDLDKMSGKITILIMRDIYFKKRFQEFQKANRKESNTWYKRFKNFFNKRTIHIRASSKQRRVK